ncbi:hypothetical protein [Flavicella sediminum]|uniref:hypothetical protein n=1 Tax=Flavicella sediminum TaxID=2585141 RepID=UPI00111E2433|nr:hypothetical protein [Flavicella sediminum]
MLGTPFKQRAHYVFNYKPRYFDERKQRLENLEKKYHSEHANEDSDYHITLTKNNLKDNWAKAKNSGADTSTSKRLAIIIAILVGICAYIFELHTLI